MLVLLWISISKSSVKVQDKVTVVAVLFISISPVNAASSSTTIFVPVVASEIIMELSVAEIVPLFVMVALLCVLLSSAVSVPIAIASPAVAVIVPELVTVAPEPLSWVGEYAFRKSNVASAAVSVPELVKVKSIWLLASKAPSSSAVIVPVFITTALLFLLKFIAPSSAPSMVPEFVIVATPLASRKDIVSDWPSSVFLIVPEFVRVVSAHSDSIAYSRTTCIVPALSITQSLPVAWNPHF